MNRLRQQQRHRNNYLRKIETLEARRVLAAPDVTSLSISPADPDPGDHLSLQASVTDADNDVREVQFYVDDQLIGVDHDGSDGWQLSFPTSGTYRIMPLGDSITQANSSHQSYRYPLWQSLIDDGYDFDLVGSTARNHNGNPSWPDYRGQSFDRDHEGHWGLRTDEVLSELSGWLNGYTPDIVLMHLGTNDLFQGQSISSTLNEVEDVIDTLRRDNSRVVVLVAELIPSNFPSNATIDQFNLSLIHI